MNPCPKIINFRSKRYRDFIKTLPCENQGPWCGGDIVAHHEGKLGFKGMSNKVSDLCCLPLCDKCHHRRDQDAGNPLWPSLENDWQFWFYLAKRAITYQNEFL